MTHSNYVLISPTTFANAMQHHWTVALGNVSSPALHKVWVTMAHAFGKAVIDYDKGVTLWHVLQPPTGTGKTQGTCVYCSLVARQNEVSDRKLGVLIVTRHIVDADALVGVINELAGRECAIAKHFQTTVSKERIAQADVLVITHAAYIKALEALTLEEEDRWSRFIDWEHGQRRLTIIDESLSEIIAEHQIRASDVRYVLGFVTRELRMQHGWAINCIEEMLSVVDGIGAKVDLSPATGDDDDDQRNLRSARIVWRAVHDGKAYYPEDMGIGQLRSTMCRLPYDLLALERSSGLDRARIAERVDDTLAACEAVLSMWAVYAKKGLDHTLNVSKLVIPANLPSPVVLDATAGQNFLWELMGEQACIHNIEKNPRSYSRVTLHVAYGSGLGKTKMREKAKDRFPKVLAALEQELGSDRKLLFCTHKAVEHLALESQSPFSDFKVAHWGAIDGKNDWQEFDAVVLFGLSYRGPLWANNVFMALKGLPDDDWMSDPKWGPYANVRQEMQNKQLSVSLIQAINRIRCRRVVDVEGNCEPADVFVILPHGQDGQSILANIKADMPGIVQVTWDYEIDAPGLGKVRKGSNHEAILAYMQNAKAGEVTLAHIKREFNMPTGTFKDLQKALRDQDHPITKGLLRIGVSYPPPGKGRGAKSVLLKR